MSMTVWTLIEQAKKGNSYVVSAELFEALLEVLKPLDDETVKALQEDWRVEVNGLRGEEFEKLHSENGGIVCAGDDGFYMDFANWLLAQGESLVKDFKQRGHQAVLDYIETNRIDEDEYLFECMGYTFHDRLDKQ